MAKDRNIDDSAIIDTHVHIFNIHQVFWEVIITLVENHLQNIVDSFPCKLKSGKDSGRFPEENIFEIADRIIKFTSSLFSTSHCILQTIENSYKRKTKEAKREKKGVCVFFPLMMDVEYGIGFRDAELKGIEIKDKKIENIKRLDEQIRIEMQKHTNQTNRKTALTKRYEYEKCMKKLYRENETSGISAKGKSSRNFFPGDGTDIIVSRLMKISETIKDKNLALKEKITSIGESFKMLEQITRKTLYIELINDITGVLTRLPENMNEPERNLLLGRLEVYDHSIQKLRSDLRTHDAMAGIPYDLSKLVLDTADQVDAILPGHGRTDQINLPQKKIMDYVKNSTQLLEKARLAGDIPLNDATIDTVVKYEHHFGQLKQRMKGIKRLSRNNGDKFKNALESLFEDISGYIDMMTGKSRVKSEDAGLDMDSLYFQSIAMKKVKEKEGMAVFPFFAIDPRREYLLDPDTRNKITPAEYVKNFVGQGKTFHGVKIYPTLWYLPSHPNLMEIYRICTEKKIPVTAHGAVDGFIFAPVTGEIHFYGYFSKKLFEYHGFKFDPVKTVEAKTEIDGEKMQFYFLDKKVNYRNPLSWSKYDTLNVSDIANVFSDPLNWIPVLENFKSPDEYADGETSQEKCLSMYINIAHLGGWYELARYIRKIAPGCKVNVYYPDGRVKPPIIWTQTTLTLINEFPGVYTDFAFVDRSDLSLNIHRVINYPGNEKLKERLMFGSDLWLMGFLKDPALFFKEYEYTINRYCGRKVWKKITNTNPREFLFP